VLGASIVVTTRCRLVAVVAAELDLSVRSVTVGCLMEVLCTILNTSTAVIAVVLAVRG
jgi:hypothetical protein